VPRVLDGQVGLMPTSIHEHAGYPVLLFLSYKAFEIIALQHYDKIDL